MRASMVRFWHEERGATAIEYAVMAGLLAVIVYASMAAMGQSLFDKINRILI